jgi:hypothetical protein
VKLLQCPCGEEITGADDDELVANTQAHLAQVHPERAGEYEREHILFMARELPDVGSSSA